MLDMRTANPASGTLQRFPGPHRNDHIVDGLVDRGGVIWVFHEGSVGRPWHDVMEAVGRERDHLVLISHPSVGVPAFRGQDDQWLRIEAAELPCLGCGPTPEPYSSRVPLMPFAVAAVAR